LIIKVLWNFLSKTQIISSSVAKAPFRGLGVGVRIYTQIPLIFALLIRENKGGCGWDNIQATKGIYKNKK